MIGKEASLELEKKSKEGYMTHSLLLQLWKEDEEVPEYAEKLLWHPPEPPRPIEIYMGIEGMKHMNELFKKLL